MMNSQVNQVGVRAESYCINPRCPNPPDTLNAYESICRNCGSKLLLQDRYRVIQILSGGGFGQTFDIDDQGTLKVLKVLKLANFSDPTSQQKVVELFQQEAAVLRQLNHSGIPKVEQDGYFRFKYPNSEELHCLVMEKIEGYNLQQWLEKRGNQPITSEEALDWLKQLAEILERVHQKNYFHRDIKPSNIMLKPNGQLVLIDFGAVKEFTTTYLHQQKQNGTGTPIGSPGYIPREQVYGKAVPQSDFFALGRTFVHLLTGKNPNDLYEDGQGKLIWRNSVPPSSNSWVDFIYKRLGRSLADFIDELMEPSWQKRPKNTQVILKRLQKIGRPPIQELTAGAAVLLGLGATGVYWYATGVNGCSKIWLRSFPTGDSLSCGEEFLVPYSQLPEMQKGVDAFAAGNYGDAVSMLEKAWQKQHSPETLIYLNNARLTAENAKAYTIAVVAPLNDKSLDTGQEMLRGVAQAQDEFNQGLKPGQIGLKVLIANDDNDRAKAKKIAEALVSKGDVLAVVGHYASEVTLAAVPVYDRHHLVLISPTSTSEDLSNKSPFFFRTTFSDRAAAQALAMYLTNQVQQRKAAVFYNPNSNFSKSTWREFHSSFSASGGQVVKDFDLSVPSFRAKEAIEQAQQQGATALVLLPDGQTSAFAFQNTIKVINANDSGYWMVGASSLYGSEMLQMVGSKPQAVSRLVVDVPWHSLSSPSSTFPPAAKKLWGGDVSWRTALAYDAATVLITALQPLPQPNRTDVKNALADPQFKATGATGAISFRDSGDRNEPVVELVKVVPSNCLPFGFRFVPAKYSTDQVERLERCSKEK